MGFSTEHLNSAAQGVDLSIKDFEGPGRMVTLEDTGIESRLRLDSEHRENKLHYSVGAHNHQAFFFTKPGAYRVVFRYEGTTVSGEKFDKELETFFVIKDSCGDNAGVKTGLEELQDLQKHLDSENAKFGKYMDQIVGGIEALRGNVQAPQKPADSGTSTGPSGAAETSPGTGSGGQSGGGQSGESANSADTTSSAGASGGGVSASSADTSDSSGATSGGTGGAVAGGGSGEVVDGGADVADTAGDSSDLGGAADPADPADPADTAGTAEGEVGGGGIRRINAAQGQQNAHAAPAHSDGAQNVDPKKTATQSFLDSLTGGGWTTGFLLGLGLMGLLGGALLFFVAARNMQRAHTLQLLQAYREISRDRAEQAYAEGDYAEEPWDGPQEGPGKQA